MSLIQAFEDNPKSGAIGTISAFLVGMIPQVEPTIQTTVIFWFQVVAFTVSITVGVFTIVSFCRKISRENRGNKT
jgi:hypothetical protein